AGDKAKQLEEYLKKHVGEQALVFSRTKHGADKLAKLLGGWGFKVGAIHGNRSQSQRDRILSEFKAGAVDVLVATDVAARGIDIPTVRHVYNYDMPNVPENYVHRIGRTARAGADGSSISFCAPAEMGELQAIEKLLKKPLPVVGGAPWSADIVAAAPKPGQNRGQRPGGGGRQGQQMHKNPNQKPGKRPVGAAGAPRPLGAVAGPRPQGVAKPRPQGGTHTPKRQAKPARP
ncbi:MAG: C-terminal helicase domain-containing protein, partial [Paracoccaceae bacterium]